MLSSFSSTAQCGRSSESHGEEQQFRAVAPIAVKAASCPALGWKSVVKVLAAL